MMRKERKRKAKEKRKKENKHCWYLELKCETMLIRPLGAVFWSKNSVSYTFNLVNYLLRLTWSSNWRAATKTSTSRVGLWTSNATNVLTTRNHRIILKISQCNGTKITKLLSGSILLLSIAVLKSVYISIWGVFCLRCHNVYPTIFDKPPLLTHNFVIDKSYTTTSIGSLKT